MAVACTNSPTSSSSNPTSTPTPNTSNSGVGATVNFVGSSGYGGPTYSYSPSQVTILHGQSVVWTASLNGHTVTLDSFSGATGSAGTNTTSFPATIVFPTAGTYYYHCGMPGHSGCGTSTYGVCTGGYGMAGSVVVN
jgi:plastocyanin